MSQWISIKERLPEHRIEVLFVNGKNEVSVGMMMDYEEGCDIWATMNSIYFNDNLTRTQVFVNIGCRYPSHPLNKKRPTSAASQLTT